MTLAELSLKRPVTVIMFFVSMVAVGLIAAFRLPLEQFPSIDAPFLFVNIPYPGSTPAEIERTIARPVEEALEALERLGKDQKHELTIADLLEPSAGDVLVNGSPIPGGTEPSSLSANLAGERRSSRTNPRT